MDAALIDLLRQDLARAGYSASGVRAALGAAADDARVRGVFAPARRSLAEQPETPLAALIRLLLLGDELTPQTLDAALPALGAPGALRLGLIARADDGLVRAALSLNPVELPDARAVSADEVCEWWILSDLDDQLRRGPARDDHVMGVGGATRSLIAQAPLGPDLAPPDRALDLGTGCGVIALHLARMGVPGVVATDVSERALRFARANARLNGLADSAVEFRLGSLFEPVARERFGLILSNPPFVITPRTDGDARRYEYRDGGMAGDDLVRTVVQQAGRHLRDGGELLCLANWESPWGENGLERVRGWIEASAVSGAEARRLAAWVIERDRVSPTQYAETWARDGGARPGDAAFETMIDEWLRDFAARRVIAIGLGSIRVRRLGDTPGSADAPRCAVRVEQATGAFGERPGPELARVFAAGIETDGMSDAEMLRRRWIRAAGLAERREYEPGAESPRSIVLHADRPIERIAVADTLLAAAAGACDGELSLEQIAAALATLLEVDEAGVAEALCAGARELVWLGMLAPAPR